MPDVTITNHGSIFLFDLLTPAAKDWVADNVPDDATYLGWSLVVEHRYASDLAAGMMADGLTVK